MRLTAVTKRFGSVTAVNAISLEVRQSEVVALLGPSGCGKTTTLRIVAGFERPDEGAVEIRGKVVNDVPTYRRNLGMVFQQYALFPHMSVVANVAFGLRMRRVPRQEIQDLVLEAMALVRLTGLGERFPSQLSGGQQQRVALARAIVTKPAVLLLDEPLGALDRKLREEMQVEIRALQRQVGITTLFVTHDQEEALTLADRIAVMERGEIMQVGTPTEIYERPRSRFISDFIGVSNILEGKVLTCDVATLVIELPSGARISAAPVPSAGPGDRLEVAIRPERIHLSETAGGTASCLEGRIENVVYLGALTHYYVQTSDARLVVMEQNRAPRPGGAAPPLGRRVYACWDAESTLVLATPGRSPDDAASTERREPTVSRRVRDPVSGRASDNCDRGLQRRRSSEDRSDG